MRIRTPSVRAASTKPAAAIVLPDAVGWRKRKRRDGARVVGRPTSAASSSRRPRRRRPRPRAASSSSSSSSSLGDLVGCRAVAVPVLARLLVRGDQLGEHAGERVDLMAAQLGAGGELRRLLGEHAVEAEHERVVDAPLRRRLAAARVHLGERLVEGAAERGARARARPPGPRRRWRKGSPAHASARRAAAVMPSGASEAVGDCVTVSGNARDTLAVPLSQVVLAVTPASELQNTPYRTDPALQPPRTSERRC